jgi:choline dehydrogenase-like flavoprotein
MIADLRNLADLRDLEVDLCVIGAGAAGITIAQAFADSRYRVCLIEAGGFDYEEETQALYDGQSVGIPVGLDFGRLREFGGTTNHWSGRCAPLDEIDFAQRDWVPHSGWPLGPDELQPYYLRAAAVCGFPDAWSPDGSVLRDLDVIMPELDRDRLRPFVWHYAREGGDTPWNFGLRYRDRLDQSQTVQVLLHANLTRIEASSNQDAVDAVTVASLNGNACRIVARHFILCCGGIENARLLLAACPEAPQGLGNRHDLVGRFFAQHPRGPGAVLIPAHAGLQDLFSTFILPSSGLEFGLGLALAPEAQREYGLLNCSAVLTYQQDPHSGWAAAKQLGQELRAGQMPEHLGEEIWDVLRDLGGVATNLERHLVEGRRADPPLISATVLLDIEQSPNRDSRIMLGDGHDALGMPVVRVDWRLSELERRTAAQFSTFIGTELARLGLGRMRLESWLTDASPLSEAPIEETYHHIGTTRMADDPAQGVVDAQCRVHGMANLWVAGSSVFPTGGHVNPTFSIVALALRLADHLQKKLS